MRTWFTNPAAKNTSTFSYFALLGCGLSTLFYFSSFGCEESLAGLLFVG